MGGWLFLVTSALDRQALRLRFWFQFLGYRSDIALCHGCPRSCTRWRQCTSPSFVQLGYSWSTSIIRAWTSQTHCCLAYWWVIPLLCNPIKLNLHQVATRLGSQHNQFSLLAQQPHLYWWTPFPMLSEPSRNLLFAYPLPTHFETCATPIVRPLLLTSPPLANCIGALQKFRWFSKNKSC